MCTPPGAFKRCAEWNRSSLGVLLGHGNLAADVVGGAPGFCRHALHELGVGHLDDALRELYGHLLVGATVELDDESKATTVSAVHLPSVSRSG